MHLLLATVGHERMYQNILKGIRLKGAEFSCIRGSSSGSLTGEPFA